MFRPFKHTDKKVLASSRLIDLISVHFKDFKLNRFLGRTVDDIESARNNGWVEGQLLLDVLRNIYDKIGDYFIFSSGELLPDFAEFPDVRDVHSALASIPKIYYLNHSSYSGSKPDIGAYEYKKISENEVEIVAETPYPCSFDRGLIKSVAEKFIGREVFVYHSTDECRMKGDARCVYRVVW